MKQNTLFLLLTIILSCSLMTACFGRKHVSGPKHRGTALYTVRGKTYHPLASARGFSETGTASWYGPGFHGRKTASGERFNQNDMTAAHKLLPFGTKILVKNLDNGLEAVVRVNDRGPFAANRILDLSKGAAGRLGMLARGTAKVRITALDREGKAPLLTPEGDLLGLFYVQVESFHMAAQAEETALSMRSGGYGCRIVRQPGGRHTVQLGPYFSRSEAEHAALPLRARHRGLFVIAE